MEVEGLLRDLAPQVLGTLTRRTGDFDIAEDAVQEALIVAAERWPRDGVPKHPRGWLLRTAERRLIDQRRSERARSDREARVAREIAPTEATPGESDEPDDTLTVLFLCCHPSLTPASAIALTLRAVGGLTTAEIARAFLVPEATMAQRISRAKRSIQDSGVRFRLPTADERPAALRTVLHVLYLIFNEGYTASDGEALHRVELSDEAIRLTRLLHSGLADDPEVAGLLALMLLLDARRPARTTADGEFVSLADQDRTRWDQRRISEGVAMLDDAVMRGRVGEYQLQAAIAALHDRARRAEDTDWPQILALYDWLQRMTGSPVVALNQAIAAGMADGPAAGLAILDTIDASKAEPHRVAAVRAHLLEMAGNVEGAKAQYGEAARLATNLPERRYLVARSAHLAAGSPPEGNDATG